MTAIVEVGILIAGALDEIDQRASREATKRFVDSLESLHPETRFEVYESRRPEMSFRGRAEPSELLIEALQQRDARHWDFVLVLTSAELASHYSPACFAAVSRQLDAAVLSLSLIDPQSIGDRVEQETRIARIVERLHHLMLSVFAHLLGLGSSDDPENLRFRPADIDDLDRMQRFDEGQVEKQRLALREIADPRLEEQTPSSSPVVFALRAAWINRYEIVRAIVGARPWEFPRRISGLTLAAFSTLAILFLTAEAWDLALSIPPFRVASLALTSCAATTLYVLLRQQLLTRPRARRSEQRVATNVSAIGIVLAGMLVTWFTLVLVGFAIATLLFQPGLVASWAESTGRDSSDINAIARLQMSCFASSIGLAIGGLGASFESQSYFRHVILVDEEV